MREGASVVAARIFPRRDLNASAFSLAEPGIELFVGGDHCNTPVEAINILSKAEESSRVRLGEASRR